MVKLHRVDDKHYAFHCPGCECGHMVRVAGEQPVWGWNGSMDAPTFTPSILVNRGSLNPGVPVCHSFVTLGKIQFLPDSTHKLAGQTVEIPEW